MRTIGKFGKAVVTLTAVGLVATTAAACSSDKKSASPVVEVKSIPGGTTSVALDSNFVSALTSLNVKPGLIGKAALNGTTLSFPITGGNVKVYKKGDVTPYVQGTINHEGSGFTLTAGSTVVGLENFTIDPGNNSNLKGDVLVNGKKAETQIKLFDLDGSTLQTPSVDSSTGVATLTGTKVLLGDDAAALLNKTFGITALKGQLLIGVATLKVDSK